MAKLRQTLTTKSMFIIKNKNIFLTISALLVVASLISIFSFGLNLGTDFIGGSIIEVSYGNQTRPDKADLEEQIETTGIEVSSIQTTGSNGYLIKMKPITEDERVALVSVLSGQPTASSTSPVSVDSTGETVIDVSALSATTSAATSNDGFQVKRFSSIGPSVGEELAEKGIIALLAVAFFIILFIAFAFRHVSRPVSSWKYGFLAVLALIHDVLIPTGVFAYLGYTRGTEMDSLFLTALLTIMALSVSDTIVVFDRIRENLKNKVGKSFEETVGLSLGETVTRSLITSLTVIFVLLVLYFFGASSTKDFALVLTLGMFFGTYSSIFVASPLLVVAYNLQEAKKLKK